MEEEKKENPKRLSADEVVLKVETGLTNSEDDLVLKEGLLEKGLSPKKRKEGESLLKEAQSLQRTGKQSKAALTKARGRYKTKFNTVHEKYVTDRTIIKMALQNFPEAEIDIDFSAKQKGSLAEWRTGLTDFYTSIKSFPEYMEELADYNYTEEKLSACIKNIGSVVTLNQEVKKKKGVSEKATKAKNAKITELRKWYTDFKKICNLAFESNQVLEKLGIIVPS